MGGGYEAVSMRTFAAAAIFCVVLVVASWVAVDAMTGRPVVVDPSAMSSAPIPAAGPERFKTGEPEALPAFSFVDGEGRRTEIKDFAGRVVLLNLWATWCGPCIKEMPSLDRLQGILGGPGFEVVALSVDRGGRDTVEPFLRKLGVQNLAMYLDAPSASMSALKPRGLPTTLLIDGDGRQLGRLEGAAEWDSPEMVAFLRKLINRGGPARARGGVVKTGG